MSEGNELFTWSDCGEDIEDMESVSDDSRSITSSSAVSSMGVVRLTNLSEATWLLCNTEDVESVSEDTRSTTSSSAAG